MLNKINANMIGIKRRMSILRRKIPSRIEERNGASLKKGETVNYKLFEKWQTNQRPELENRVDKLNEKQTTKED